MLTWLGCAQGTDIDCYHRRPTGALRFSRSHSCHGEFQGKLGCSLRALASSSFRKTPPWPIPGSASRARAQHVDKDPDIVPVCVIESNCVACLSTRRLRAFHSARLESFVGRNDQFSVIKTTKKQKSPNHSVASASEGGRARPTSSGNAATSTSPQASSNNVPAGSLRRSERVRARP